MYGVEARDGAFFCTAMAGDGRVEAMRVFPTGRRGVAQFVQFAARQGPGQEQPVIGLIDRMSGSDGGEALAEAFRRKGFQVRSVSGERLAGMTATGGLALDGGRNSRRAAQAILGGRDD